MLIVSIDLTHKVFVFSIERCFVNTTEDFYHREHRARRGGFAAKKRLFLRRSRLGVLGALGGKNLQLYLCKMLSLKSKHFVNYLQEVQYA
jgi:hypothetical protein